MKPENGKLKLPLSSAPEIYNNSQQAWLKPNSNFDLSLIRWLFGANEEMAKALHLINDIKRWHNLLTEMDTLAVENKNGPLLVSPDEALKESHRHFSHLMAIYPLGTLNVEGTDNDREIINASLRQIDSLGSKFWDGYSFSWMACIRARAGQANRALESLEDYMDCTSRNGFHLNGPQRRKELSDYYGSRAFTLEGNFAASQAVHEMVLQSWGNRVRIFPAIPKEWQDVSFHQLRAEQGFVIDAERKGGKTIKVKITATIDQTLHLKNPFSKPEYESNIKLKKDDIGDLLCELKKGQTLVMTGK
jgi:alpha-L-fucosidase 2